MSIAFYTGASGLNAYQSAMNVTAHNIANANTNGFKTRRAAFDDLLRSRMNTNVEGEHLQGHGVKQQYIDLIMTQGPITTTGYELDFYIAGDGFFAVDNQGTTEYTRDGAFDLLVEGATTYLVTNDGAYVLNRNGQRITVARNEDGIYDTSNLTEQIGIHIFNNSYGLTSQNGARFTPSETSGEAQLLAAGENYELVQGGLERSNVELAVEMVNIINAQRAYQLSSRVVQTADTLMETVNNLR